MHRFDTSDRGAVACEAATGSPCTSRRRKRPEHVVVEQVLPCSSLTPPSVRRPRHAARISTVTSVWLLVSLWSATCTTHSQQPFVDCFAVNTASISSHHHGLAVSSSSQKQQQQQQQHSAATAVALNTPTRLYVMAMDSGSPVSTFETSSSSRPSSRVVLEPLPRPEEQRRTHNMSFLNNLLDLAHHHHDDYNDTTVTAKATAAASPRTTTLAGPEQQQQHTRPQQLHQPAPLPTSANAKAWARKYTSVDALRQAFGSNKNGVWGDLDAASARRLYKSLLPTALLQLHNYYSQELAAAQQQHEQQLLLDKHNNKNNSTTLSPPPAAVLATDLAPLAYQARLAAKLYARERCTLPARVAANLYDGFRSWRRYGQFNMRGMSYQQVWDKYADMMMMNMQEAAHDNDNSNNNNYEEDVAAKIGLKILERACATNPMVDSLVFRHESYNNKKGKKTVLTAADLEKITAQLEEDVRQLLLHRDDDDDDDTSDAEHATGRIHHHHPMAAGTTGLHLETHQHNTSMSPKRYRTLRGYARVKRNLARSFAAHDHAAAPHRRSSTTTHVWNDRERLFQHRRRPDRQA